MGRTLRLTATVTRHDEGRYCARCVQVEAVGEGGTVDEALNRLREALERYFQRRPPLSLPSQPPIVVPVEIDLPD